MTNARWIAAAAVVLIVVLAAAGVRSQESERPPLEAYGALPSLEHVQISPSGDLLASVTVVADQRAMLITDLATTTTVGGMSVGDLKVRDLQWVGDDRVLTTISVTREIPHLGVPTTELFMGQIYSIEDERIRQVFGPNRRLLPVMLDSPQVRQTVDGPGIFVRGYGPNHPDEMNLYLIDVEDGRGRVAIAAGPEVEEFVLDPQGEPLARADYSERHRRWTLNLPLNDGLAPSWSVEAPVDLPYLLGPGRSPRTIIVNAARDDLADAGDDADDEALSHLFEVNVDTGVWAPLSFGSAAGFLVHHPRTGLLIGAGRTGELGVEYQFTDPEAAGVWAAIARAFEGSSPRLVSWSGDLRQVVIFTSGSGDSGLFRLVDLDTGEAGIVGEAYPAIAAQHVGEVRPVHYVAQDGLDIHGYLTLPPGVTDPSNLPLVVLAHGGPASRDEMGFDWWAQALASRGYAVLQPNFRGSTGYGLTFLEAGYGEWGRKMQTDLSDGVRHLAAEGIIDPARACIVGASYGGYAALAGVTIDRGVYRCAVSVAGLSDLRRFVEWEANLRARHDNQVTRYWNRFMGADELGDRDLDRISPARLAGQADAPILLLHGRDDTVVPVEQSRAMASALRTADKPHELIELVGEDHWLSHSDTRHRMLAETVRFLELHNPAR